MYWLLMALCLNNPLDDIFIRYLSLYNIPTERRGEYTALGSFVINTISQDKTIHKLVLTDDKIRFDLRDYKIDPKVWDTFAKKHPYGETMRLDWFIVNATKAPDYYNLLGIKDEKSFLKSVYADTEKVDEVRAEVRGIVMRSKVSRSPITVSRIPTLSGGYLWRTLQDDSILATLPNGLICYFLTNKKGEALTHQDPKLSVFDGKMVNSAQTCIFCHSNGIKKFKNDVHDLMVRDPSRVETIKDVVSLYGIDFIKIIERDQKDYQIAVHKATKMKLQQVHKLHKDIVDLYETPVTLSVAAKEAKMTEKELSNRVTQDLTLLNLNYGSVRRDVWESLFPSLDQKRFP